MKNKNRASLVFFIALCATMLYPYAKGAAQPKEANTPAGDSIRFDDPAHRFFFNHQTYLTKHGKSGETSESWNLLTPSERTQKAATGETALEKLHTDLLSKEKLSAEETELFQAVWGKGDAALVKDIAHKTAVDREKSGSVEKVNAAAKNLGGFQGKGNWGQLFDGGQNSSKEVGVVNAGSGQRGETSIETHPKAVIKSLDEASVPPIDNSENNGPFKHPLLPLAAGAVVIAGACYAMRKETAQVGSPSKVQIDAINDLIGNPERLAEFMKSPDSYAAKYRISFDPAVVKMTQAAILKHDQEIVRLGSDNPYRSGNSNNGPIAGGAAGTVIGGSSTVDSPRAAGAVVTTSTVIEGPLPGGGACVVAVATK